MQKSAQSILKNTFGYDTFRENQREIIDNVLRKRDSLVVMPTGSGKSICYQIPAIIFDGLTIVISPLISLMKDQVEQLRENGVNAVCLNSSLPSYEYSKNVQSIRKGEAKLLYVAPETLLLERTLKLLESVKIDCFTIDEAHCISEWGHDFRPEYRQLAHLKNRFSDAALIALTATATPIVQNDIIKSLELENANKYISSFDRKNLFLEIVPKTSPINRTLDFIKKFPNESGLIYCFSRKQVDELSAILTGEGFSVKPYHAGLSDLERSTNQELFIRDDIQIIVATIAFGMGINKPNIRYVIHFDLPKNIESYYQQIGRAGRDGLDSHCILFFGYGDIRKIKYFFKEKTVEELKIAQKHLDGIIDFCETEECRRKPLLNYFGESYKFENCGMCDNCTNETKSLIDLTIPVQKFLSCIKRTDEIYGANHIALVLRGSQDKKILEKHHDKLSTYGIGKDISKSQWLYLARQLIRKEYLIRDQEYGSLKLTPKAWEVLHNKAKYLGKLQAEQVSRKEELGKYDLKLYEILSQKRKSLADTAGFPPYVIFSNKTLIDMAIYYPQTQNSFLKMYGVGQRKAEKYGDTFMVIIRNYCQKYDISENPKVQSLTGDGKYDKRKFQIVGEKYNQGSTTLELAKYFSVKQTTIINNLNEFFLSGHSLRKGIEKESTLDEKQTEEVYRAFKTEGVERLSPVFHFFNEKIPYHELKILRLAFFSKKTEQEKNEK
ncbi:MAG: DNA helicase RecQ [Candidatus Cloacimonadota bacterium]|nr:DNA helicase RecQ [Candidatus Cloacimonadota bacterium]